MMTDQYLSLEDIAGATGKTVRTVRSWANAEGWPYTEVSAGRGRSQRYYMVSGLPDGVRRLLGDDGGGPGNAGTVACSDSRAEALAARSGGEKKPPDRKALAKADVVRLYCDHLEAARQGNRMAARQDFIRAYNSGIAYPVLYDRLGKVSWKTIEGWKTLLRKHNGDPACLVDRRGKPARTGRITDEQERILIRCMLHPNRPRIAEIIRMARAIFSSRGFVNGYSDATYRRWIYDWRDRNYPVWVFHRRGEKAWNDEIAYYIERDYALINVGDIIVADGHVLNFEVINPFTGKPKRMTLILWYDMKSNMPLGWEIMPTEDTAAISSALRRALLTLGKVPKAVYLDNGKAFRSRFFAGCPSFEESGLSGLYERLGCKTIFAWPYHGQSKTIERFFGSLAELERWMPTYTGTSIDHKPPRMNRGERLHRRIYEASAPAIPLADAHRAIAAWFDDYARRPQQGHMAGASPVELFSEGRGSGLDAAELDYLMMSMEIRHIRRNGIHFLGQNYYAPELYGRRRPVVIRYDLQDTSALHVIEPTGEYICMAEPVEKVHPAAHALGSEDDQERLRKHIKIKQRQKKDASRYARDLLQNEIMPEHQRRLADLGVDGSGRQIEAPASARPAQITQADAARIMAEASEIHAEPTAADDDQGAEIIELPEVVSDADETLARIDGMADADKYEALLELEIRGADLAEAHRAYMRYYELTDAYAQYADYYENRRAEMAVKWQMNR